MRKRFFILAALLAMMLPAEDRHQFTGVITDSMCADGDHSAMRMGPTDAECTKACIEEHDAMYVLYDGKIAYTLDDQKKPESFAGKKVVVTGSLDDAKKTIHVDRMVLATDDRSKQ